MTSDAQSDGISTQPTTPASSVSTAQVKSQQTPTQIKARLAGQVAPAVPALPQSPIAARKAHRNSSVSSQSKNVEDDEKASAHEAAAATEQTSLDSTDSSAAAAAAAVVVPKAKPSSWASLLRSSQKPSTSGANTSSDLNTNGAMTGRGEALSDVLNDMNAEVESPSKTTFLQPRGLVNTGNMCYMNSVSSYETGVC
jgi:ubiquitin carboxyl-terminal hydrolase 10